jgi:phosphate/sulfate permease
MNWGQRLLRGWLRLGACGLLVVVVVAAALWGTLALWFGLPGTAGARLVVAVLFAGLGIGGLVMALRRGQILLPLLPFTIALTALLVWWSTIEPRNDRAWQPEVARLPSAKIDGDLVTLRDLRSFEYRTAADYTEHWYDRTVDLRRLDSLDLIAAYWAGDAIAHIIVSFGFAGDHVAISIETRKEKGEAYSSIAGFFKRYELIYVVGDERDLIRVRTNYRQPEELVYVYRTRAALKWRAACSWRTSRSSTG